jgi:hypothetical protein
MAPTKSAASRLARIWKPGDAPFDHTMHSSSALGRTRKAGSLFGCRDSSATIKIQSQPARDPGRQPEPLQRPARIRVDHHRFPSPRVDIFSSAKQRSKQGDSLSGTLLLIHWWCCLNGLGRRRVFWRNLRNRNAVNRQKASEASILLAKTNIFLLWRLEWKRVCTIPGHVALNASVMPETGLREAA